MLCNTGYNNINVITVLLFLGDYNSHTAHADLSPQEYNCRHPHRGTAIIINNLEFDACTRQAGRSGAKHDSENLETTFDLLGFHVKSFTNLTTTEMLSVLHKGKDCFKFYNGMYCFRCLL